MCFTDDRISRLANAQKENQFRNSGESETLSEKDEVVEDGWIVFFEGNGGFQLVLGTSISLATETAESLFGLEVADSEGFSHTFDSNVWLSALFFKDLPTFGPCEALAFAASLLLDRKS